MEDDEEEEDCDNIPGFAEYGAFDETAMGGAEKEVAAEDEPTDDIGQAIRDAQRDCKSERERIKFQRMHARGSHEIVVPKLRRGSR